jgi:DNA-binding transcriptional ArsR family regulator
MPENDKTDPLSTDLFSLALAPMSARVRALEFAWDQPEKPGPLPSRTVQIAGLIVAETVRLIRLGGRPELTEGALELAQLMARPGIEEIAVAHPESHRLAGGSSVVLGVASAPSSGGGELAMLRSWNGKAREAVELLSRAHGRALARSELRSELGDLTESHLSHLLSDLESSGLALRIREGKTVTVHLGPTGRSEPVQERLASHQLPSLKYSGPARDFDTAATRVHFYLDSSAMVSIAGHDFVEEANISRAPYLPKRRIQSRHSQDNALDKGSGEDAKALVDRTVDEIQAQFRREREEGERVEEAVSPVDEAAGCVSET